MIDPAKQSSKAEQPTSKPAVSQEPRCWLSPPPQGWNKQHLASWEAASCAVDTSVVLVLGAFCKAGSVSSLCHAVCFACSCMYVAGVLIHGAHAAQDAQRGMQVP